RYQRRGPADQGVHKALVGGQPSLRTQEVVRDLAGFGERIGQVAQIGEGPHQRQADQTAGHPFDVPVQLELGKEVAVGQKPREQLQETVLKRTSVATAFLRSRFPPARLPIFPILSHEPDSFLTEAYSVGSAWVSRSLLIFSCLPKGRFFG